MIALADLLEALAPAGGRLVGLPGATTFDGFAYDSRKLRPGELFLAVCTARADGHDFIPEAIRRGAAGVIGDRLATDADLGVTTIAVDDTLAALRAWARFILARVAPTVVAVVGETGKTIAARAAVAVLSHGFAEDPGVFDGNNHRTLYGLAIALGKLTPQHQVAVLELGREAPGDLLSLAVLTRPSVVVAVSGFADAAAQGELAELVAALPASATLILNADDPRLGALAGRTAAAVQWYRSGSADVPAAVWAEEVRLGATASRVVCADATGERALVQLPLLGAPGVAAALAATAVGLSFGHQLSEIAASLEQVTPAPGRLRPLAGAGGYLILDDSCNAGPAALAAALALLDALPGRKVVVLGELATANPEDAAEVQRQAGLDARRHAHRLVALGAGAEIGALAALAAGAAPEAVVVTDAPADAAAAARAGLGPGDLVLVIGGAEARMERVVEALLAEPERAAELLVRQDAGWKQRVFLSRERPTWVEVDLAAIGHNVQRLKAIAHPAALCAVLKADGYGHGAVRVARTALLHGADYLATACLSEAVTLRRHGIRAPILILGFTPPWQAAEIVRHDLTATVYSLDPVRHLARAAQLQGRRPARVQIKVDTGMGRLGLLPAEVPAFVQAVRALPGADVEGIYTHFASADAADPASALAQIARFDAMLAELERLDWRPRYVHAANSAATLRFPQARYDLVRTGIAMYGVDPSEYVRCPPDFRPALTFKTLVAQVKELPPGSPISYGGAFVTARPSHIAVLPVGYGDGFRRSPQHWGEVLVRGQRAPIVGRVCMDMCMIDVTDIPGVRAGDEVVLIGRQGRAAITADDVAARLGTIAYEVITQILARVPREVP